MINSNPNGYEIPTDILIALIMLWSTIIGLIITGGLGILGLVGFSLSESFGVILIVFGLNILIVCGLNILIVFNITLAKYY